MKKILSILSFFAVVLFFTTKNAKAWDVVAWIKPMTCISCGTCVSCCPMGAIKDYDGFYYIGEECVLCGACFGECPVQAIELDWW